MVDKKRSTEAGEAESGKTARSSIAVWLGRGDDPLEMGSGRGPRTLQPHEFVSWFFSRDGH